MKIAIWIFLLFLVSGFGLSTSGVRLEYTFHPGDEYTMTQNTSQTIKQFVMGAEQHGENVYAGEIALRVTELTKSGARLEAQFIKLRNISKSIMGDLTMDSEGTDETVQNRVFKALMRKSFFIVLNKSGRVEYVEGEENLWSGISAIGLDIDEETPLKMALNQMLSNSALKNNVEQAMVYYTDKQVKPGDTWNSKNEFPMDFPIQVENSWSLVNLTTSRANVKANGIYATTDRDRVLTLPNGMKAKVDLGGTQLMEATVSTKTGWPIALKIFSNLTGKMVLLAGGMLPMDMDIPMEVLTETEYTIVKK